MPRAPRLLYFLELPQRQVRVWRSDKLLGRSPLPEWHRGTASPPYSAAVFWAPVPLVWKASALASTARGPGAAVRRNTLRVYGGVRLAKDAATGQRAAPQPLVSQPLCGCRALVRHAPWRHGHSPCHGLLPRCHQSQALVPLRWTKHRSKLMGAAPSAEMKLSPSAAGSQVSLPALRAGSNGGARWASGFGSHAAFG